MGGREVQSRPAFLTFLTPLPPPPAEKNLAAIKGIMEQLPAGARLSFVGDGPQRVELEAHFAGMPVVFMVSCRPATGGLLAAAMLWSILHAMQNMMPRALLVLPSAACTRPIMCMWDALAMRMEKRAHVLHPLLATGYAQGR